MTIQDSSGTQATLADLGDNSEHQGLPRGSNLGRYVIIEPIGSGGMGAVYRAYDPQLNRGVALKMMSVKHEDLQAAERAKARLIREAQALAQLAHPNVVAVHDAGTFEDDVFIAMELVEGKTLDDWMRQEKRSIQEILEVMIAAGRGLSAAHKVGLVHRDFKPGNVIVGDDGRVRVLDFGLARAADQQESIDDEPTASEQDEQSQDAKNLLDYREIPSDSSPNLLQSPLTNVGGVLGTPLYMAPEQHLGQKTDERTDQFGFCLVLYEVLYGKRPFDAKTIKELKSAVVRQQISLPQADTEVPVWLWQIIQKGLSADPKSRYPSIRSLLEELEHDPEALRRQRRLDLGRKTLVISLIILTITLPVGVWYGLRYRTVQLCKAAEGEMDGVWDRVTKTAIRQAFLGTEKSFSKDAWERVENIFDKYIKNWMLMRSDVCEARLVSGTQSEELFDLRMSCLRKRLQDVEALAEVFARADAKVVQKAIQASIGLESISECANIDALVEQIQRIKPPKDIGTKKSVEEIRQKISKLKALVEAGKYQEGMKSATEIVAMAEKTGYFPVQAESMLELGSLQAQVAQYEEARKTLEEAALIADKSRHDKIRAKALNGLIYTVGYKLARHEEAEQWIRLAQAAVFRLDDKKEIEAKGLYNAGALYVTKGDLDKALLHFEKSLVIREKAMGLDHPDVALCLTGLGLVYSNKRDYNKATQYYQEALRIYEKALGKEHPHVAASLNNLGVVFDINGEYDKAIQYYQEAFRIYEKVLGKEHPHLAASLNNLGVAYDSQGDYDKAFQYYQESLRIRNKALGNEHPNVAMSLVNMAYIDIKRKRYVAAEKSLSRVKAICGKKICKKDVIFVLDFGLAQVLWKKGGIQNRDRATELAKTAQRGFSKMKGVYARKWQKKVRDWLEKNGN